MAEKSYHKTAEERVKSIEEHLKKLQSSADHFLSLYHYCREADHEAFSLSLDDIGFFHGIMDMAVDTISAELGMLKYEGKPQAEAFVRQPQARKGETPFHEIPLVQALNRLVELNNLAPEQLANVKNYVESLKAEALAQGGAA
jgi:hypothetical protein